MLKVGSGAPVVISCTGTCSLPFACEALAVASGPLRPHPRWSGTLAAARQPNESTGLLGKHGLSGQGLPLPPRHGRLPGASSGAASVGSQGRPEATETIPGHIFAVDGDGNAQSPQAACRLESFRDRLGPGLCRHCGTVLRVGIIMSRLDVGGYPGTESGDLVLYRRTRGLCCCLAGT